MKHHGERVDRHIFRKALKATSEKRMSTAALQDIDTILFTIQSDLPMHQRWNRYCQENYYANGISFDEVINVIRELVK